jgi:hypothetical protein
VRESSRDSLKPAQATTVAALFTKVGSQRKV